MKQFYYSVYQFMLKCPFCVLNILVVPALSTHFKVDGASRRVGGENDYVYYGSNCRIY